MRLYREIGRLLSTTIVSAISVFVLGCSAGQNATPIKDKFELKQTKQGQIVRLNKETGEIDIIADSHAMPARADAKSVSSTSKPGGAMTPKSGLVSTKHSEPGASAPTLGQPLAIMAGAPIFVTARKTPTPLQIANKGTAFRFRGAEGDWYQVEFSDRHSGSRMGFVQKKYAIAGPTVAADLEPMDLSIREPNTSNLEPVDLSIRNPK